MKYLSPHRQPLPHPEKADQKMWNKIKVGALLLETLETKQGSGERASEEEERKAIRGRNR